MSSSANPTPSSFSSSDEPQHEWTAEQTYTLLVQIKQNPKYTQTLFPPTGHTPAAYHVKKYARQLCLSILYNTGWMDAMKEKGWVKRSKGISKPGRSWEGDDPVTLRLRELPDLARHYETRLDGYVRYDDIPAGSKIAKRWRKYEKCPTRKWVLIYLSLKQIQMAVGISASGHSPPGIGIAVATSPTISHVTGLTSGPDEETIRIVSKGRKRRSQVDNPPMPIKRSRTSSTHVTETPRQVNAAGHSSHLRSKPKLPIDFENLEIIEISSDDDDDTQPRFPPQALHTMTVDSDSDSEEEVDIRQISPPLITLPEPRRFIPSLSPALQESRTRLAFQKPEDDQPTDSDSDVDHGVEEHVFTSISYTTDEQLFGMFSDPNLKPCQPWRRALVGESGLPSPPESGTGSGSGSGVGSPVKDWVDGAADEEVVSGRRFLSPESELEVMAEPEAEAGGNMDIDIDIDGDVWDELREAGGERGRRFQSPEPEVEETAEPEATVEVNIDVDLDMADGSREAGTENVKDELDLNTRIETGLEFVSASAEEEEPWRPATPPLPSGLDPSTSENAITPVRQGVKEESSIDTGELAPLPLDLDCPATPPLPSPEPPIPTTAIFGSPARSSVPDPATYTPQTDAERATIALLWRTLISENHVPAVETATATCEDIGGDEREVAVTMPAPRQADVEAGGSSLMDWIEARTGPVASASVAGDHAENEMPSTSTKPFSERIESVPRAYESEQRPISPPDAHINHNSVEIPETDEAVSPTCVPIPQEHTSAKTPEVVEEDTKLDITTTTNSDPDLATKVKPETPSPSETTTLTLKPELDTSTSEPTNSTAIHQAKWRVAASILNLLITQSRSISAKPLLGCSIAFTGGHIPFKTKLSELITVLGGEVMDQGVVRALGGSGTRYMIHPISSGSRVGDMKSRKINGVEHLDILGFLEVVSTKIGGTSE